ncbi:hypothetical protein COMNV_00853 [Commensalibacter sp. Nvir]|uniref:hypothetical protein n=1 Tax=Commensalibacter sp. Nvir TaxID=3069817 RepID=UPI002D52856E|nr:hypothetical protein COMNV_00853 [Commensalibacter sp. Nvir]
MGTELTGIVELTHKTDTSYTYKVFFEGYPEETSCSQTWEVPPVEAYQIIEPWFIMKRDQFPQEDTLVMKDILLVTNKGTLIDANWQSYNSKVVCTSKTVTLPYWNGLA